MQLEGYQHLYLSYKKTPLTNKKIAAKINLTVKLMKKKMSKSVQVLAKQEKLI